METEKALFVWQMISIGLLVLLVLLAFVNINLREECNKLLLHRNEQFKFVNQQLLKIKELKEKISKLESDGTHN